jgi:uncharacterized protein
VDIIIEYKVLIIPAVAWFIAEALKMPISWFREREWNPTQLFLGGMPSAHSALVCSLATTVGFKDGFNSVTFAIALGFALVVMQDAGGVRKTVGLQSTMLNRIIQEMFKGKPEQEERLRELIGHTSPQIFVGALLGIVVGWILSLAIH